MIKLPDENQNFQLLFQLLGLFQSASFGIDKQKKVLAALQHANEPALKNLSLPKPRFYHPHPSKAFSSIRIAVERRQVSFPINIDEPPPAENRSSESALLPQDMPEGETPSFPPVLKPALPEKKETKQPIATPSLPSSDEEPHPLNFRLHLEPILKPKFIDSLHPEDPSQRKAFLPAAIQTLKLIRLAIKTLENLNNPPDQSFGKQPLPSSKYSNRYSDDITSIPLPAKRETRLSDSEFSSASVSTYKNQTSAPTLQQNSSLPQPTFPMPFFSPRFTPSLFAKRKKPRRHPRDKDLDQQDPDAPIF